MLVYRQLRFLRRLHFQKDPRKLQGIKKAVADGYLALALAQHFYRIPSGVVDKIIEEQLTKTEADPEKTDG